MQIAGVILAGGNSERFGSDKAAALLNGRAMITHVAERLEPQVERIAIAGAKQAYSLPYPLLEDGPRPARGPLAGVLASLQWANSHGFSHLVTAPCDVPHVPLNLVLLLSQHDTERPVVLESKHGPEAACALWPVTLAPHVAAHLEAARSKSLIGMLESSQALVVPVSADQLDGSFANINTPDDLAALKG